MLGAVSGGSGGCSCLVSLVRNRLGLVSFEFSFWFSSALAWHDHFLIEKQRAGHSSLS